MKTVTTKEYALLMGLRESTIKNRYMNTGSIKVNKMNQIKIPNAEFSRLLYGKRGMK